VNGVPTPVHWTDMHLAAVEVPAGHSDVEMAYLGPPILRVAFWASLLGWVAAAAAAAARPCWLVAEPDAAEAAAAPRRRGARLNRGWVVATAVVAVLLAAWALVPPTGPFRMKIIIPWGQSGGPEPLLAVGHAGAAEIIYVQVLGPHTLRVGRDRWGHPSVDSAPFEADLLQPQTVEILLRPATAKDGGDPAVSVRWNGHLVLQDRQPTYPYGRYEVYPGANPMGASSCGPRFRGHILSYTR
jgi:hypothetical protein